MRHNLYNMLQIILMGSVRYVQILYPAEFFFTFFDKIYKFHLFDIW